jgi:hypothetical protein
MLHHVERIKRKPEHHRRAIAFGASAAVTGVIALAWLAVMAGNVPSMQGTTATVRDASQSVGQAIQAEGISPSEYFEQLRSQSNDLERGRR